MDHKITIDVYGMPYHITTGEDPTYVEALGKEIDAMLRELMAPGSKIVSLPNALVLVALSYLDAYKKSEAATDNLREQVGEYLEEASKAKQELIELKMELERMNRDHQLSMDDK